MRTLVQISVSFISGGLAVTAVGRRAVVVDVRALLHSGGEHTLVYVSGREVRLPEVRCLVVVVELEFHAFGNLIVWDEIGCQIIPTMCRSATSERVGVVPSLLPAEGDAMYQQDRAAIGSIWNPPKITIDG